jgi:hypothetical protein
MAFGPRREGAKAGNCRSLHCPFPVFGHKGILAKIGPAETVRRIRAGNAGTLGTHRKSGGALSRRSARFR